MTKLKMSSALNKAVENAVKDIIALEKKYNNKEVIYKAARRYNDRIYVGKKTKPKKKKCQKKQK